MSSSRETFCISQDQKLADQYVVEIRNVDANATDYLKYAESSKKNMD
jgi:hypothetical protein